MRKLSFAFVVVLLCLPAPAFAQGGFGIGPRITFVRGSEELPEDNGRFWGGAMRLGGGRAALELGMDFRTDESGPLNVRVRQYPIHASLLLFPVRGRFAPFVLAGVGWYSQNVTRFEAPTGAIVETEETTRTMGYHAGLGAEIRVHRRLGLHGDYRYTRLQFGDDDEDSSSVLPGWIPGAERLKLSHEGSAFTWGATIYF